MSNHPTQTERDGYLVVENALSSDLAACLTERLESVIQMRRALYERGEPHHGRTQIDGANTRIFHILEDDPVFAELIDPETQRPFAGYSRDESDVLQNVDGPYLGLSWRGRGTEALAGRSAWLRLFWRDATVYSVGPRG